MKTPHTTDRAPSRPPHLQGLGYDENFLPFPSAEKQPDDMAHIPDLILPAVIAKKIPRLQPIYLKVGLAVVAAVGFLSIAFDHLTPTPEISGKGQGSLRVYKLRAGEISPFVIGEALHNGDNVGVEISARAKMRVIVGVATRDGKLLSDPEALFTKMMPLKDGETAHFPMSFELVGDNAGETLVVGTCDANEAMELTFTLGEMGEAVKLGESVNGPCVFKAYPLR